MTLYARAIAQIDDFLSRHPDVEGVDRITGMVIDRSNRGDGPGNSLYLHTASGIGFEIVLQEGDDVRGAMAHLHQVH